MATGDVYKLTTTILDGLKPIENVYHYFQQSGSGGAEILVSSFVSSVLPNLQPLIAAGKNFVSIAAENIDDVNDFFEDVTEYANSASGAAVADFTVFKFDMVPVDQLVRMGRKALGPLTEALVANNTFDPSVATAVSDLEAALGALISSGPLGSFVPGIWSPANATHAFDLFSALTGAAFRRVSTQNSRK